MATANILVGAASEIPNPPAGEATLFVDTDNNNILTLKFDNGSTKVYSADNIDECCSCDIAKKITDSVACAFKSGMITSTEFGVIMGSGITVTSTKGTDTDGNSFCKIDIGTKNIPVTSMSIDNASPIAMLCNGSTVQLTATVLPSTASNKKVKWLSSNTSVATVDIDTGLVTEVGTGTCIITAYTEDGGFTDTITINADQTGC